MVCHERRDARISLLTKEELDRIFNDVELDYNREDVRKKRVAERQTKNEEINVDITTCQAKEQKNKSFWRQFRRSMAKMMQKIFNRKTHDYYKRMEKIKSQWVSDVNTDLNNLQNYLKAEMPAGWQKAVKSGTLLQSFAVIDRHTRTNAMKRDGDKDRISNHHPHCNLLTLLLQLNEDNYTDQQLANILIKLKYFAQQQDKYLLEEQD